MKQTRKEMIAVLEAAQEGKTIQGKRHTAANAGEFYTYDNDHRPMWNFDAIEYRVKPEPRVIYRIDYEYGSIGSMTYTNIDNAKRAQNSNKDIITTFIEQLQQRSGACRRSNGYIQLTI